MKYLLAFVCTLFCLSATAQTSNFSLTGKIQNTKSDTVMVAIVPLANLDEEKVDTIVLKNGILQYQTKLIGLSQVAVIPFELIHKFKNGTTYPLPGSRILFFVNPGDQIQIEAKIEKKLVDYNLKGNKISEQFADARRDKIDVFSKRYEFEATYNQKKKAENTPEEEKQFMANRGANNLLYQTSSIKYIKAHLNDDVSAFLLLEITNKDTVSNLYQKLTANVKESYHGKILSKLVKGWYASKAEQKLPALLTATIDGKPFKIGESNGKFILLDFWGSWCTPCVAEIPALKVFYQKNADKVQLVGLICKDTKEKALTVINKNNLKWPQLFSATDEYAPLFGITAYPTKILIDPSGVIVKTFVGINENTISDIEALINK